MRSCARPEQSAGHKIASAVFIHYMTSFYSLLIRGFGEPPLIKALRPDRAMGFVAGLFFYWSRREHRANIPLCREKSMHVRQRVNKKKICSIHAYSDIYCLSKPDILQEICIL